MRRIFVSRSEYLDWTVTFRKGQPLRLNQHFSKSIATGFQLIQDGNNYKIAGHLSSTKEDCGVCVGGGEQ